MTVAYPLKSQSDHTELRYSLRSIERFYRRPTEVLIIGEKLPDWITNVTLIRVEDITSRKQLTIKYKILAALEYSKEIFFMNDDVYLLQPPDYKYHYHGDLISVGEAGARPLRNQLLNMGLPTKNFDGHYPLVYKQDFVQILDKFAHDVIVKSAYCNYLQIEGEYVPDNKLITQKREEDIKGFIHGRPSFSTGAHSLARTLPILHEYFPNKSRYEV